MSVVFDCTDWFEKARPEPTEKDKLTQIGASIEEMSEYFEALGDTEIAEILAKRAKDYYEGKDVVGIQHFAREEALDAMCDIAVTLTGVAHHYSMDFENAWNEVNRSNNSKFVEGKPIKNEHGKIIKGENYTPPDLTPYI